MFILKSLFFIGMSPVFFGWKPPPQFVFVDFVFLRQILEPPARRMMHQQFVFFVVD